MQGRWHSRTRAACVLPYAEALAHTLETYLSRSVQVYQALPGPARSQPTACLMPTSISPVFAVCCFGEDWGHQKRELLIRGEDTIDIEGESFWRIAPHMSRIVNVVAEGADGTPEELPKNMSLTRSKGLQHLLELRNEEAWPPIGQAACALFEGTEQGPPAKKPRRKQRSPSLTPTVRIMIPAFGNRGEFQLTVKRPTHPSDRLAVPISGATLDQVLYYMHWAGFEDAKEKIKPAGATKGIWWNKQRQRWLAKVVKSNGERGFKSAKNAEELEEQGGDKENIAPEEAPMCREHMYEQCVLCGLRAPVGRWHEWGVAHHCVFHQTPCTVCHQQIPGCCMLVQTQCICERMPGTGGHGCLRPGMRKSRGPLYNNYISDRSIQGPCGVRPSCALTPNRLHGQSRYVWTHITASALQHNRASLQVSAKSAAKAPSMARGWSECSGGRWGWISGWCAAQ